MGTARTGDGVRRGWRSIGIDLRPLGIPQFRWRFVGFVASFFGAQITVVAVAKQVYDLTGSSLAVGAVAAAELIPLMVLALVGGAIADAFDRRKVLWTCEIGILVCALLLAWNASLGSPQLWAIYVLAALIAGLSSIAAPARWAITPRILPADLYAAGAAVESLGFNSGAIAGPAVGGMLVTWGGHPQAFVAHALLAVLSLASLTQLRSVPSAAGAPTPSLKSIIDGFRFLRGQHAIQGTYLIDFIAMIFGMPQALFPAIAATRYGDGPALGLLFAAPAVGALCGALTSGWTGRIHRHGQAVIIAVIVWGVAITLFGVVTPLVPALACLDAAGWADQVSVVFRKAIWNRAIPDAYRGRLAGISWANVRGGFLLGNVEAGTVARFTNTGFSVVSGGLLCIVGAVALAAMLPAFRRYDARNVNVDNGPTHDTASGDATEDTADDSLPIGLGDGSAGSQLPASG